MKPQLPDFAGRRVVVMGLGHFGGGIAAARWLCAAGARVTVTDLAGADRLAASLEQLRDLPITYRLGGHDPADLEGCDLLVVSPAVPRERSEFLRLAIERGVPLSSEMNLFLERCPVRRVIGVTGTAGKSTTTAMIGSILQSAVRAGLARRAWTGGNIGHSLLGDLPAMSPEDLMVLELSSFQLEDLAALAWSPPRAVITNIRPNHLDRHGTLENYAAAKLNLVRHQSPDDVVIIPAGDAELRSRLERAGAGPRVREAVFDPAFAEAVHPPGPHNRVNAALAIAAARSWGLPDDVIRAGLDGFAGLPHRLEFVASRDGVRWYNDSKSTTPESTRLAIDAFEEPVIVLVGGADKGMSFAELGEYMALKARAVIGYGAMGPTILEAVRRHVPPGTADIRAAASLEEAERIARGLAVPGDVVVLSPACTSYDMFANYEERGEVFRRLVRAD